MAQGQYDNPVKATLKGITDLFRKQEKIGSLKESDRIDGKTCLVTGANSGLGFAIARQLAERGGNVVMACRSGIPEAGEKIKTLTGSDKIEMVHVDLSDAASIQKLVEGIKSKGYTFDIAVFNAAIVPGKSRKTKDGIEEMFMVNYLSKFILINKLLKEELIQSQDGTPRIVITSSESHRNPKVIEWEKFGEYEEYGMGKVVARYGYFKLFLTTFANELSRRLASNGTPQVSVFSLCPGPVNSNIAREAPGFIQPVLKLTFKIFFKSPMKAAEPAMYLAVSPSMEGKTREYLFLMSKKEMDEKAIDEENGSKLWTLTQDYLETLNIAI